MWIHLLRWSVDVFLLQKNRNGFSICIDTVTQGTQVCSRTVVLLVTLVVDDSIKCRIKCHFSDCTFQTKSLTIIAHAYYISQQVEIGLWWIQTVYTTLTDCCFRSVSIKTTLLVWLNIKYFILFNFLNTFNIWLVKGFSVTISSNIKGSFCLLQKNIWCVNFSKYLFIDHNV